MGRDGEREGGSLMIFYIPFRYQREKEANLNLAQEMAAFAATRDKGRGRETAEGSRSPDNLSRNARQAE